MSRASSSFSQFLVAVDQQDRHENGETAAKSGNNRQNGRHREEDAKSVQAVRSKCQCQNGERKFLRSHKRRAKDKAMLSRQLARDLLMKDSHTDP